MEWIKCLTLNCSTQCFQPDIFTIGFYLDSPSAPAVCLALRFFCTNWPPSHSLLYSLLCTSFFHVCVCSALDERRLTLFNLRLITEWSHSPNKKWTYEKILEFDNRCDQQESVGKKAGAGEGDRSFWSTIVTGKKDRFPKAARRQTCI